MDTELNKEFSPEKSRMAEKHLKKCSTSLVIREMQIKTTLGLHLTPVRMAKIKNSEERRCWRECGEKGTLLHCWWDGKLVKTLWKWVWQFLRKLDIVLSADPAIPLLGIYSEDAPTCIKEYYMLHYVHSCLIYNSQKLERAQMSLNRGMHTYRKCGTFTQWSTIQLLENNEFMKFLGKWMQLENIILWVR